MNMGTVLVLSIWKTNNMFYKMFSKICQTRILYKIIIIFSKVMSYSFKEGDIM